MSKILVLSNGFVDVCVDDYNDGCGNYVNQWEVEGLQGTYDNIEALIKRIAEKSCVFSDNVKDYCFIDGRITTSELVDNDNYKASDDDIEQWKQGKKTLYCADFNLSLLVVDDVHEMTEDEAQAMGLSL